MASKKNRDQRNVNKNKIQKFDELDENNMEIKETENVIMNFIKRPSNLRYLFALLLVILGILLFKNKDLIVAATVSGKPIYKWQLNSTLVKQYGKQTLETMITEQIIKDEIAAKKIIISQKEIDGRINEFKKTLGPTANLNDFLAQRGLTEEAFRQQVEMQIGLEKILADKTKVSSKEAEDYVTKNLDNLVAQGATEAASQKKAAENEIKQQKLATEFEKWYQDARTKAKINIFLK